MSYTFTKPSNALFDDDFTIVTETVEGITRYKLQNWYQYQHDSGVPFSYVYTNDDFYTYRDKALKIGGSDTSSNNVFLVSNKYFKYDSAKPYILRCRIKSNTNHLVKFGFIGLTSRPSIIKNSGENLYSQEMFNLHRFVFSHNGVVNDPVNNPVNSTEHYAPINKYTPISSTYSEYLGYITGSTGSTISYSTDIGRTLGDPIPLRTECEYFMPFISINTDSSNVTSILEFFTIHDSFDVYNSGSVTIPTESVLNHSTYF